MFKAYFRSSARDSLLSDMKNVGRFSLVDTNEDCFYELKFSGVGDLNTVYNYPIYKKFTIETIRRNIDILKETKCIVKDNRVKYKFCNLLNFADNYWVFKEEGSSRILKYNNPQEFTVYLLVSPKIKAIDNIENDYRVAYIDGKLFELTDANYSKLEESKDSQFTSLLPNEITVKFYDNKDSIPKHSITDKAVEFAYEVNLDKRKVIPQVIPIRSRMPLKFLYYNYQEFRTAINSLRADLKKCLSRFHSDIKYEDDYLKINIDFSSINELPVTVYYTLTEAIKAEFHILLSAFNMIVNGIELKVAEALPFTLVLSSLHECIHIKKKLKMFLQTHAIRIDFVLDNSLKKDEELVSVEESNLNLRVPLHFNKKNGNIEWLLGDNVIHSIVEKVLQGICQIELKNLGQTTELRHSNVEVNWNHANPLGLKYEECLNWAESIMRTLFNKQDKMYFSSNTNRIKVEYDHKDTSIGQLRILLTLPILLHNIVDAIRIAKGTNACPHIEDLIIKLNEKQKNFWELKESSSKIIFTLNNTLATEGHIPSADDIIKVLFGLLENLNSEIEEAIDVAEFILVERQSNKCGLRLPVIREEGKYVITFKLFDDNTEGETEIDNEDIVPFLFASIVPINGYSMPIPVDIELIGETFMMRFVISKLNGPNKLVVRCGKRILFSTILYCYEDSKFPKGFLRDYKMCEVFHVRGFSTIDKCNLNWTKEENNLPYFELKNVKSLKVSRKIDVES